ncbi:hypothetical protein RD792_011406 [Penstemon davidsonii]|uniref:BRO1 domain-containing protein n=1 Tax=Penstemon davidsonii TaxID=160366 RepID=A0ABR0D592_9LAMI|nr:hypothetical protein RD792_011406 [Penstemon davidsonii]
MASPSSTATTNIMLAIFEKKTNSLDLYRPLRNFIVINYSEREAQNLEDDLQTLKQLRSDIERGGTGADSPQARRDVLQNYYKALCAVESRFPISPDKDHVNTLTFTWFDAFKNKLKASQQNIHLEKAAVLFNLGSVHSQIGLSSDRSTVEGRRQASHSFIAAAGAFAFLRDNVAMKASVGNSTTVDVSVECVGMLERLMLAQAQECVYENTIAKGSSPGVCAKISRQAGLFYEEALAALTVAPLNQHFDKAWIAHVQLKAALFYAEACYRYSLELHEKEEIAEEIARLKSGTTALSEAKKTSPKGAAHQLLDAINKLESNLTRNLERAMKENDRVYLMRVPPSSSLPPLPTFSMVKPMPMNEVLDASREKMFASLVPDSSAKALSRYTEMVDDIIRTQAEKLQQGSELARVRLKEMDLPDSILALEGNMTLPTDLKEDIEAVQICGGPAGLEGELQQLKDLRRVNQELLVQTEEQLQKEATEDAQFRNQFGTRWTRPQSSTLTKNLQDRLNRFAANLKQAAESDARIERSVREHSALMSILDCRPIETALPSLARPIMSLDANEDAIVGGLKQSLRQLETLGAQRAGLEDMLKEMKRKDAINNVKQQCSDFVMTRNIQCREMIDDVQRQVSGLSFQDGKSSSSYSYPSMTQRTNSQPQPDPNNMPNSSHFQTPTYQPPQQPTMPTYTQTPPPYGPPQGPQQPQPPYHAPVSNYPYHPQQQQPAPSHEYGQPAYPGWRGPYYNAPPQQQGSGPRPPYTASSPYPPPHQSGYYRQ